MVARLLPVALLAVGMTGALALQDANTIVLPKAKSPLQADQPDPSKAPKVYVIPMRGQLGTDIHTVAYKDVINDVKAKKPDLIVFTLESADFNHNDYLDDDDPQEVGALNMEDARTMVMSFRDELRAFPQVMWVKDAVGWCAVLAFPWPDMYMAPDARILGLMNVYLRSIDPDHEKWRKFLAAFTAMAGGFLEAGGYDSKILGEAMMRPERKLSVSWEGRKLVWRNDENGTYVIDNDPKRVAGFNAKIAEDLMLSKGTCEDLDDLMYLLGYREWDNSLVKNNQDGTHFVDEYIKRWRDTYKSTLESWKTFGREMDFATGDEKVAHLGKAKKALQDILDGMNRYEAVEFRWKSRRGQKLDKLSVEGMIKELKEQIAAASKKPKSGSGNGSGGSGPRGGARGPGGAR